MLLISFAMLLVIGGPPVPRDEARTCVGMHCALLRWAICWSSCWRRSRWSSGARSIAAPASLGLAQRPEHRARVQADTDHRRDRGAVEHALWHRLRPRDRAAPVPGNRGRERARRPAARAVARRRRPLALPALRAERVVRRMVRAARRADPLRPTVDGDRDDLRVAAVRRPRGHAHAARDRRRAGAGRAHARRRLVADVLADHAAVDPLGGHLRRRPHHRPLLGEYGAVAVVSGRIEGRPRRRRCASRTPTRTSTSRAPTGSRSCSQ